MQKGNPVIFIEMKGCHFCVPLDQNFAMSFYIRSYLFGLYMLLINK